MSPPKFDSDSGCGSGSEKQQQHPIYPRFSLGTRPRRRRPRPRHPELVIHNFPRSHPSTYSSGACSNWNADASMRWLEDHLDPGDAGHLTTAPALVYSSDPSINVAYNPTITGSETALSSNGASLLQKSHTRRSHKGDDQQQDDSHVVADDRSSGRQAMSQRHCPTQQTSRKYVQDLLPQSGASFEHLDISEVLRSFGVSGTELDLVMQTVQNHDELPRWRFLFEQHVPYDRIRTHTTSSGIFHRTRNSARNMRYTDSET